MGRACLEGISWGDAARALLVALSLWATAGVGAAQQPAVEASTPVDDSGDAGDPPGDSAKAQPTAKPAARGPLRVAVAGSEPFVLRHGDETDGFVVELWQRLEDEVPDLRSSTLVTYPSVDAALRAVREGQADAALGPISITADRAQTLSFSQPFYIASLAILAPATQSLWARLAPFATRAFGAGLLLLLLVLSGVGALLWLSERRENPEHFPERPLPGIGNGIWLALVTMTTVGYGDLAPVTRRGRIVAGAWMVIAMLTASSLTASIATALTLSQLETPGISRVSDLRGKAVAVLQPSLAAKVVSGVGGRLVSVKSAEAGIDAVETGLADAMVWDKPVLAHFLQKHPRSELSLSPTSFQPRGYGIATRKDDDPLLRDVDLGILRLLEAGELEALEQRWLPR